MSERIVACPECGGLRETYSADEGTQGFVPPSEAPRIACGVCGHDRAPAEDGPRCTCLMGANTLVDDPACPVHGVPAVERPSAADFERVEGLLATVDPDSKRGENTWLFVDEVASIARVLAAAREAERLRDDLDKFLEWSRIARGGGVTHFGGLSLMRWEEWHGMEKVRREADGLRAEHLYAVAAMDRMASRGAALEAALRGMVRAFEAEVSTRRCSTRELKAVNAARAALAAGKEEA